jgi:hypothetical protein
MATDTPLEQQLSSITHKNPMDLLEITIEVAKKMRAEKNPEINMPPIAEISKLLTGIEFSSDAFDIVYAGTVIYNNFPIIRNLSNGTFNFDALTESNFKSFVANLTAFKKIVDHPTTKLTEKLGVPVKKNVDKFLAIISKAAKE